MRGEEDASECVLLFSPFTGRRWRAAPDEGGSILRRWRYASSADIGAAPHLPFGHILTPCGEKRAPTIFIEAESSCAYSSPRSRGEGGAQRRMRGGSIPRRWPYSSSADIGAAPHLPFGHLLP